MEVLRFVLLGLAVGSLYGVAAQGIVVIYRSSGVVNFAQGARDRGADRVPGALPADAPDAQCVAARQRDPLSSPSSTR